MLSVLKWVQWEDDEAFGKHVEAIVKEVFLNAEPPMHYDRKIFDRNPDIYLSTRISNVVLKKIVEDYIKENNITDEYLKNKLRFYVYMGPLPTVYLDENRILDNSGWSGLEKKKGGEK